MSGPTISRMSPSGIRTIFERIPPGKKISFIPILAEWIGQSGKIGGVVLNEGIWFNIGSRAEYLEVHRTIEEERWSPDYVKAPDWPLRIAQRRDGRFHCAAVSDFFPSAPVAELVADA